MPKRGKAYQDSTKLVERNKFHELEEAIKLVKQTSKAKFDETVELHIKLGCFSCSLMCCNFCFCTLYKLM